jgi:CheY-like chemotaxis protein
MTPATQQRRTESRSFSSTPRPGNLFALEAVLRRPEYDLKLAHNGMEALALLLHPEYAVVLLDVAMPTMDGFEVARIMKSRGSIRTIPIIFVSASASDADSISQAYSIGAVDFLQKAAGPSAGARKGGCVRGPVLGEAPAPEGARAAAQTGCAMTSSGVMLQGGAPVDQRGAGDGQRRAAQSNVTAQRRERRPAERPS